MRFGVGEKIRAERRQVMEKEFGSSKNVMRKRYGTSMPRLSPAARHHSGSIRPMRPPSSRGSGPARPAHGVFEDGKQVLGYAYASSHRTRRAYQWCVEVSVYVHAAARQYGVGRALYRALFEILRRQGYVNAYAGITLPNPASMGLHESLGFLPVGVFGRIGFKFGQWHDVAWLQLRLLEASEPVANPDPAPKFSLDENVAPFFGARRKPSDFRDTASGFRVGNAAFGTIARLCAIQARRWRDAISREGCAPAADPVPATAG
jgi:phosphinothricin acetyltransferase